MKGIAILRVDKKTGNFSCLVGRFDTPTPTDVSFYGSMTDMQVIATVRSGCKPLNFAVDSTGIKESCGAFSRLEPTKGVEPRVILAELQTKSNRTLGYVTASVSTGLLNIKEKDMFSFCEKARVAGVSFIQNGIYRVVKDVPTIACYPNSPYHVIYVNVASKVKPIAKPVTTSSGADVLSKTPDIERRSTSKGKEKLSEHGFTQDQLAELMLAKENGVNPSFIANRKLSPEQMRILWVAKKNRVASEYFARPEFSREQMIFFADRLIDKRVFKDCYPIINPKYNVDQLAELYLGITQGVDISSYANEKLSAEQMYVERMRLEASTYSKTEWKKQDDMYYIDKFLSAVSGKPRM